MPMTFPISAAAKARAERDYFYRPEVPLAVIAAGLKVSRNTLALRIKEWGWPPREPLKALARQRRKQGRGQGQQRDPARAAPADLAARLKELLAARLAAAERRPRDLEPMLAGVPKLVAAIAALTALDPNAPSRQAPDHDEPPPRSLDALHDELAGHLARLKQDARSKRRLRRHEPAGA